jgi:sulfur-oxidizing protein SoxZ
MARSMIKAPKTAQRGEIIAIRTLIQHPMETGHRPGADGKILPQNIVRRFSCRYAGELVFSAQLYPAIAANPFLEFNTIATESGTISLTWEGDFGFTQTETISITVTG